MSIIQAIKERWSPRAFSSRPITNREIDSILEAASWAPSSMNEQPWRYFYSFKGEMGFEKMLGCLLPGNSKWAKDAQVLILSVARKNFEYKNRSNRHSMHDLGAANALLALQASSLGFQVHQMGGFDIGKTIETFKLDPELSEPVSFIAAGYPGDPDQLSPELKEMETAARKRKSRGEFGKHFI